jgi:flagellin
MKDKHSVYLFIVLLFYKTKNSYCLVRFEPALMKDEDMVEIDKTSSVAVSAIQRRTAEADSIVALAQQNGGNPTRTLDFDGVRIKSDRIAVAAGAQYTTQLAELRQAAANASDGASLLDVADAGLSRIADKLDRMDTLANTAARTPVEREDGSAYTPPELSGAERASLNLEFEDLRSEIDAVASSTSFNGVDLLAGDPANSSNPLMLDVQTGGIPAATVTISMAAADIQNLSAPLETVDLLSEAASTTAVAAVDVAQGAVAERQAAVRGARAQLNSVETAAGEVSAVVEGARELKTSPETVVELSRIVANQVSEEGGVSLSDGAQNLLKEVLLRMSVSTANGGPASGSDGVEEFGGKTSGAPAAAPAAAFAESSESSEDAA